MAGEGEGLTPLSLTAIVFDRLHGIEEFSITGRVWQVRIHHYMFHVSLTPMYVCPISLVETSANPLYYTVSRGGGGLAPK